MSIKLDYATRETVSNLRRNLLLTTASMLTVAVSLSMVGVAILLRYGVDNATQRWKNGVEFEIFLNLDATPEQQARIERELVASPDVERGGVKFVSQQEQYQLFKLYFNDQPEYLQNVKAQDLPASYRVKPKVQDVAVIRALGERFRQEAGVKQVEFAADTVDTVLKVSRWLQVAMFVIASVLLFAAVLLIFNTIRMGIFARRREIEVMKLVGATNWFIRVPFMLEGLIQGVLGAAVSFGIVSLLRRLTVNPIRHINLFSGFTIINSEVRLTGALLMAIGAAIGAIGAGVAVTRFLDV
ncbi:MAG: cell division transport system permease protein [Actinomycetota bacterium]|jgi:cell division transport system permease protein|nr:cell division transport system permease protein [Actinomycetota bacterium]